MQLVHNPGSETTPFRVVTNSSCPDPVTRESLNGIMAKGPNCLADQWEVLIRFRNYVLSFTSDVTKAYYSMLTGLLEKHIRRIIWRDCNKDDRRRVFAYVAVSFGDKPAAALLEICIKQHINDCGKPATVYSDAGTNLVSAAKDLQDDGEVGVTFDFSEIVQTTGVTWFFAPPGAQFRNGCSRRMSRSSSMLY